MTNSTKDDAYNKGRAVGPGRPVGSSVGNIFQNATELHQRGDISGAVRLYKQVIEQFPDSPKTELAKTLVAGLQKERISILWKAAWDARSHCNNREAIKLYKIIIEELPGSPESNSAQTEIKNTTELQQKWDAALNIQAQGDESKALEIYRQIVERYPNSPEAENSGLMMAIIHQNQLMPRGEVTQDFNFERSTPETILSHFLLHKKATSGSGGAPAADTEIEEEQIKKIENIWVQANALEKEGHVDEAIILYKKIINTSANGHRVRDAKYCIEKILVRRADMEKFHGTPKQWGLTPDERTGFLKKAGSVKALLVIALLIVFFMTGFLLYRDTKSLSWSDVVENAKKGIVVVKTAAGPGTGFLVSKDGLIVTNAHLLGKDKEVEVRLYSGALKKATIVKAGMGVLDIAVLKIDGSFDHFLSMSESDKCVEGGEIRVVGAPLGMEYFVTKGIISHCNMERDGVKYIQTDPAMNVGYSGGPGLNDGGKVIGLSTTISLGDNAKNLNLILPITVVKDFMEGRLTVLEEALTKKELERSRKIEESKKQFVTEIENINRRLQGILSIEYKAYLAKVIDLLHQHRITQQQADLMVEQVQYGPSGTSMTDWVQSLALKVAEEKFSENAAIQLIKERYKLYY